MCEATTPEERREIRDRLEVIARDLMAEDARGQGEMTPRLAALLAEYRELMAIVRADEAKGFSYY